MESKEEATNTSAFEYSQAAVSLINSLCEPFFKAFGLTGFAYVRVFYDGKYLLLSNKIEWVRYWLDNISHIKGTALHAMLQNVPEKEPFYFLWDTANQDKLIRIHNSYGLWHGFDINYRLEDSVEVWTFCTSSDKDQINDFYINNFKLFHRFFLHFREKAHTILDVKDKGQLAHFKESIDISFHPSFSKLEEVGLIFPSLIRDGYSLQTKNGQTKFSKRELECLFYLSQGKTAKEIARALGISPRTVESYINAVRYKTGCNSKSEILDFISQTPLKWL